LDRARGVHEAALRDLAEARAAVEALRTWKDQQTGASRARRQDWALVALIISQLVMLAKLFVFHN
jgi:hypothetical protein